MTNWQTDAKRSQISVKGIGDYLISNRFITWFLISAIVSATALLISSSDLVDLGELFIFSSSVLLILTSLVVATSFGFLYLVQKSNTDLFIALVGFGCALLSYRPLHFGFEQAAEIPPKDFLSLTYSINIYGAYIFAQIMLGLRFLEKRYDWANIGALAGTTAPGLIICLVGSTIYFLCLVSISVQNPQFLLGSQSIFARLTDPSLIIGALALACAFPKTKPSLFAIDFWGRTFLLSSFIFSISIALFPQFSTGQIAFGRAVILLLGLSLLLLALFAQALQIITKNSKIDKLTEQKHVSTDLLHKVSLIIFEAPYFKTALQRSLNLICSIGGWNLGHIILLEPNSVQSEHIWSDRSKPEFRDLIRETEGQTLLKEQGLTDKVWKNREYIYIPSIFGASGFNRKKAALTARLNSVVSVPILNDDELIGIIELFSDKKNYLSQSFLKILNIVCKQYSNAYKREQELNKFQNFQTVIKEMFEKFPAAIAIFDENDKLNLFNTQFNRLNRSLNLDTDQEIDFIEFITMIAYNGHIEDAVGREPEWIEERFNLHKNGFQQFDRHINDGRYIRALEFPLTSGGTACVWVDITELKTQELEFKRVNEVVDATLSGFPGMIAVFDHSLQLRLFNDNLLTRLNLPRELFEANLNYEDFLDLLRDNLEDYGPLLTNISKTYANVVETDAPALSEMFQIRDQVYLLHIGPVQNGGFVLSLFDVTEISEYQQSLHEKIEQVTDKAELALKSAREQELLNQAKTDFVRTISHEFRTPMNGIMTATNLLRDTSLDKEQVGYLKTVKSSANSLMRLLNDLMELNKIETNQLVLEQTPISIPEFIHNIQNIWIYEAAAKDLDFKITKAENIPEVVETDGVRLQQILHNLIENAIKFTDEGSVIVNFNQKDHAENKTDMIYLRVEVQDTGKGISKEAQANLFDKFTQEDLSQTRKYGGSGIGLAMAQKLVTLMGGEIGVESEHGNGTRFWFELPVRLSNWQQLEQARSKSLPEKQHSVTQKPLNILVAEDNEVNQLVIQQLLKKWGHSVEIVPNGVEAVAKVASCQFDMVLMDIQMPEMDGHTATIEIRKLPGEVSKIPVVALTANAMYEERKKCLDSGMNDYLTKPVEEWVLQDTLKRIANQKYGEQPAMESSETPYERKSSSDNSSFTVQVLNTDKFKDLIENFGIEMVQILAEKLIAQYSEQREEINAAIKTEDWQLIGREAHSLKSSFAQFGLERASEKAKEIDQGCKSEKIEAVINEAGEMIEICDQSIIALQEKVESEVA
ncbi:GAF domain-containing hybrid sensor histidine kinase/response regulator [Sneathiella limimaris]|uniref:GAF domain-containing hybrid sensor histidine kinase/response regulator n=1 Tax=Sneathiella limimaris TaxID=1964213 RepID=UPI00146A64A4|nr:ATP-binding protein [Sneathiella limimaris]